MILDQLKDLLRQGEQDGWSEPDWAAALAQLAGPAVAPSTAELESARVDLDRLARCGYPEVVYAEGKTVESVVEIFAALSEAGVADRVEILQMDVTDRVSIAEAFARADRWVQLAGDVGRIVGLVNNAGVVSVGPFEELPPAEVGRVIETNLLGTLAVTHAALPRMRPHGGRIVFISSSSGLGGLPTWSAYAASKWGVEGFAESLAFEGGPHGSDVALGEPGVFPTGIWRDDSWHGDPDGPYATLIEAMADADRNAVETAGDPAVGARTVAACLSGSRPVIRHPVGRGAWVRWAARGVVPFGSWRQARARQKK